MRSINRHGIFFLTIGCCYLILAIGNIVSSLSDMESFKSAVYESTLYIVVALNWGCLYFQDSNNWKTLRKVSFTMFVCGTVVFIHVIRHRLVGDKILYGIFGVIFIIAAIANMNKAKQLKEKEENKDEKTE